ncbi:MAG: glycoside hydrolase family 92, partial [Phycisphaerales bacterium]|nr:glycoside hydrolase family 92 [Phycisphaerales bacterium]
GANWTARNLIDDDAATFYYPNGKDSYEVLIDLGKSQELGAFSVLTMSRPNNGIDSMMARYELYVSASKVERGKPVAAGDFEGAEGKETVATFAPATGRYVTLKAFARPNANKEVCLREFSLVTAEAVKKHAASQASAAAEKKAAWENRDSDKAVAELGKDFLDLVFCTPDDINRANLRARPKLETVGKLKLAGKYAQGLTAFRDYYFDKLRRPQSFGLHANDVHPYGRGYAGMTDFPQGALDKELDAEGIKKQIAAAEDLLKGDIVLNGAKVHIGEPGSVDWEAPAPPYGYSTKTHQSYPYRELWWGSGFQPLFTAYMTTKDERYLKRWLGYMDDWSMNCTFLADVDPVSNHDNSLYPCAMTIRMLAGIANSLPYDSDVVSSPVFARIMKKLVMETPLTWIVYMRSNGNGWTPGAGYMLFAMMVDEFKVAPTYFRETRRRNIEDINVLQGLRDGTETHQWPGYNYLLLNNIGALRLMEARAGLPIWAQPAWEKELHTPGWQKEEMEALQRRASYMIHWGTPSGEYPLVTHQEPPVEKRYKLREFGLDRLPGMLDDPTDNRIYSTLYDDGSAGVPEYTAEWFPYGGYSIARDGWKKTDGYGAMFCSPQPGCGGVGSGCKNNIFGLAAYGMDLISDDLVHAYVRPTSPIQVDGKRQQLDFYVPKTTWPTGHRGDLIREWTEPSPFRWHASDRYNLMEGVYAGPYANDFHNRKEFIDDVSHQRVALYARQAGLWILTDRMLTERKHDYEQLWYLPVKRKAEAAGFKPEEIVVDAASKSVKTRRTGSDKWWSWDELRDVTVGNVNLSMYQFTDAAVKYDSATKKSDEMYDWQRVGVTWQGEGNQQIVTALFPRKPTPEKKQPDGTENDLARISALPAAKGVTAFEAVTPEGWRVSYLAATDRSGALSNEGIEITGEALLVVHGPGAGDGVTGVVLGCKQMKVKGSAVAVAQPDFEFALPASMDARSMQAVAIYRPISPVKILPESDVFAGEQQVTLKSETPGVAITYTLDGTEPTPQSTAYKGPFTIDRTLVVKARAYRPGVDRNPAQPSGTHGTPTTYAPFTKKLASLAEDVKPASHGLNYEYYCGNWRDMWLTLDRLTPEKKGNVPSLFDMSAVPEDNPPVGAKLAPRQKSYAFKYSGYLKVPEDGVYTIHAPHEYTHLDQIAGYELQVYLGHALNPDGNG